MVSSLVSPFVLALSLAATLPAQVFLVDVNNGPGTNYTSIAAATAAVPDGSVLRVRAGSYGNFRVVSKSLTIDADPGVFVSGNLFRHPPIEIAYLGAGQAVSLRGFRFQFVFGSVAISCRDSAGAVIIEDCSTNKPTAIDHGAVRTANCEHVYVRNCELRTGGFLASPLESYNSNVAVSSCDLLSEGFCLRLGGSRIHLTDCTLDSTPTAGLQIGAGYMIASTLVVNGDTTIQSNATSTQPAILGDGTAVLDPSVQLLGSTGPIAAGITVATRRIPLVVSGRTPATNQAFATMNLEPGETGVLFVGFPDQPEFFAGLPEPFWLENAAVQATGGGAALTSTFPVPNAPWVIGVQIMWQGATYGLGTSNVHVGNPAPLTLY